MFLVAGLGNPGEEYALSPHNMGFLTVDRLAERHGIRITRTALGDLSGSAQETVSRVLGKLENAGLIQRKGRSLHITAREMRGGAVIFLFPQTALPHKPN